MKYATLNLALLLLGCQVTVRAAGFVYETPWEYLASGDFNGDGVSDVLVLDKATGNARVGYQGANSNLVWSAPLPTGVPAPAALTLGHFRDSTQDALAITSVELNRIHLLRLSDPTNTPVPAVLTPAGLGPDFLVALNAPLGTGGSFDWLAIGSGANNTSLGLTEVELYQFYGDAASIPYGSAYVPGALARGNALSLSSNPTTYVAAMQRDTNDTFAILAPGNQFAPVVSRPGLAVGSAYAFGTFNQEARPRFLFYVPGQSNLLVQALGQTNGVYYFDTPVMVTVSEAISNVFYLSLGSDGTALIQFGDGVQGLTLPGGSPLLGTTYRSGSGGAGNVFTGVVPLTNGNFVLLDAPAGSLTAAHAQVVKFNGTQFTQLSAGNLPALSSHGTRATVWLFQAEPFVSDSPGFISSVNAPDWTSGASISGGVLNALTEADGGPSSGLHNPTSNNLGAAPAGAAWAIPDQYRDSISLFAYNSPQAPEPITITILPAPGLYGSPIQVSFTTLNPSDQVYYRLGANADYQLFGSPFSVTNDVTVQYYGSNPNSGARSRLYAAGYSFGSAGVAPPVGPLDIAPGSTNPAPQFHTNQVILSDIGTVFYGRRPPLAGKPTGFLGPTAYLSFANSPFSATNGFSYFYLETFETGALTVPGVTPTAGWQVLGPGPNTDSVDADDGTINGFGTGGHSYYSASHHSLTLTFNPAALGGHYPTHVGMVWTDVGAVSSGTVGHGNVLCSALDANGNSLGTNVGINVGDGLSGGQTAEDRFFGLVSRAGISSFTLTMTNSTDWEVDHLQYGYLAPSGFDGTIWTINLDGSGETFVTTGARPRASRDGQWLAFLREGDPFSNQGNLWLRNLSTGAEGRLFVANPNPNANTNKLIGYDWDLTDTNLVFDYNNRFWSLSLGGGTSQFPLASRLNQGAPAINPVDGRVAFQSLYPGASSIFLAPPALTSDQVLLSYPLGPRWPAWSPDGGYLALADGDVSPVIDGGRNLWVAEVGASNTSVWQITGFTDNTNGFPHGAQWSPDGEVLVGAGTIYLTNGIWVLPLNDECMCADGPIVRLPTSPGDPIDFVGSVVASAAPTTVVQTHLFIQLRPDSVLVYWSAAMPGFTLETAPGLTPPTSWTTLPPPYAFDGYFYQYVLPLNSLQSQQYFRLRYTGMP